MTSTRRSGTPTSSSRCLIGRAGPPYTEDGCYHGTSPFRILEDDPNQVLFYTNTFADLSQYDPLFGRWKGKQVLTRFFRDFLVAQRPDIVHVQHTMFLGYDVLRVIRNTLGDDVPIVYTMHEYMPICFHDGQMVRTMGNKDLCRDGSPRRCHECFPHVSTQDFFRRKRFIQSHLDLVDHFIAPGEYVRDRYVDWGIPAEKITVEPQGMIPVRDRLADEPVSRPRNRFAFFGQLNPYKGADTLLEAMDILGDDFEGHLSIFGANLEIQSPEFRKRINALLDSDRPQRLGAGGVRAHEPQRADARASTGWWFPRSGGRPGRWSSPRHSSTGGRSSPATSAAWPRRSPTASTACTSVAATRITWRR